VTGEISSLDSILDKYGDDKGMLIQVLLDVQQELNWIPPEAIRIIGQRLGVPLSQVYRVASFYKALSLTPRGRHLVRVCLGTACHVRGGMKVMDRVTEVLDIAEGETTPDMRFTVERVNCLGCCALGPVMVIDGTYHGKVQTSKVKEILGSYQ
jgi:NADH-quinone oxidoreductase subunit E